jgi:hypothetical protein
MRQNIPRRRQRRTLLRLLRNLPATRRCEVQPYEKISEGKTTYGHWQDERGFWRYGKKLTKAESAEIFKKRDAA